MKADKTQRRAPSPLPAGYRKPPPEVVDPVWLLKAGAIMLAVCLVCAYAAICILFSTTQWQLVLHPTRSEAHSPAALGLKAEDVSFGVTPGEDATLRGWWLPSHESSKQAEEPTVLMLTGGDGSAGDWLARAKTFHDAQLNVLLFDYRGYGHSGARHPTEATMEADSRRALEYLQQERGVPPEKLLIYGAGAGASLAVRLCAEHPKVAALILESADGDFGPRAAADPRSKLVPFRWLFHEAFPLAAPLRQLTAPKLLLTYGAEPSATMQQAGDPKMMVEMPTANEAETRAALRRFLDSYIAHPPAVLQPIAD